MQTWLGTRWYAESSKSAWRDNFGCMCGAGTPCKCNKTEDLGARRISINEEGAPCIKTRLAPPAPDNSRHGLCYALLSNLSLLPVCSPVAPVLSRAKGSKQTPFALGHQWCRERPRPAILALWLRQTTLPPCGDNGHGLVGPLHFGPTRHSFPRFPGIYLLGCSLASSP